ncbi:POTRA domain-containing protein [Niabella beijingensis]|uniref:POTRA domain-containing protein n=1 Tax=Niabella beijingensis TaxID=2872700 RepID=UPI001CBCAC12|nr:POTRA domain-containing protein [Niabella beijingensis]MBZ4188384.1 BamA/TamA family outer membrane protein [Niabella beijingensis]
MTNVRYLLPLLAFLWTGFYAAAQDRYTLIVTLVDKDSNFLKKDFPVKTDFINKEDCRQYTEQLIPLLQARGFVTASVDSLRFDSTAAYMQLFAGVRYKWEHLTVGGESLKWLTQVGYDGQLFTGRSLDYTLLGDVQQRMLNYFENHGHPFARIYADAIDINGDQVSGHLKVEPGPLYRVDSIRITGNARLSNDYLQNYLDIKNGSVYSKEKLQRISSELKKLNYIEESYPPRFYWGSTGGVVELFLQQKKSNQVNFIIGFLPNSNAAQSKKLLITGEGLLNLKNALGGGETIGLVWQKLEAASQRLNVNFLQPYLFRSRFGLDFGIDMLKRDSSYLNFDYRIGMQYALNTRQNARLFYNQFSTIINTIDKAELLQTRQLPAEADVKISNVGIEYQINTTNYIFNPVSGLDIKFTGTAGIKKIKKNSQIIDLEDPEDPDFDFSRLYDTVKLRSVQVRTLLSAARYFPLSKRGISTLKTALQGGYLAGGNIFRNELFQIGGYRLLRGFDEQSQFLSRYAIATLEYRYLVGENSYLNAFADGGWGYDGSRGVNKNYNYLGVGIGLAFETKAGVFNLAWAVGKRNDTNFNLRQSKIHFGFINYF